MSGSKGSNPRLALYFPPVYQMIPEGWGRKVALDRAASTTSGISGFQVRAPLRRF